MINTGAEMPSGTKSFSPAFTMKASPCHTITHHSHVPPAPWPENLLQTVGWWSTCLQTMKMDRVGRDLMSPWQPLGPTPCKCCQHRACCPWCQIHGCIPKHEKKDVKKNHLGACWEKLKEHFKAEMGLFVLEGSFACPLHLCEWCWGEP